MKAKIQEKFKSLFGQEGKLYMSNGRINLIGEHTDYNGGYDFVSFQWLHNGSEVEGATGSYYYEAGKLKPGDEYAVLLTTAGSDKAIPTCSYIVPALSQPAPAVVAKKQLENGRLCIIVDGATYNAQGHRIR